MLNIEMRSNAVISGGAANQRSWTKVVNDAWAVSGMHEMSKSSVTAPKALRHITCIRLCVAFKEYGKPTSMCH